MTETFIIFDNGGKTFDRFTILNKETGDIFGASEDPTTPDGFNKFFGNCAQKHTTLYGAGWRERSPGKKFIKLEVDNFINNAKLNPEWIGSEIEFNQLPEALKLYIMNLNATEGDALPKIPPLKKIG